MVFVFMYVCFMLQMMFDTGDRTITVVGVQGDSRSLAAAASCPPLKLVKRNSVDNLFPKRLGEHKPGEGKKCL